MKLNFNPANQTNFLNVARVNQSVAKQNGAENKLQIDKPERRDIVTISPQGKKQSLLESFMKQKMSIIESKNDLIVSTIEKGGTLDSIKTQLETFDEQLKGIDEQLAKIMADEVRERADESKEKIDSKPKTEEEIQNERLSNVTSLATGLQKSKIINSVKTNLDREARVLKSEIELDKSRGSSSTHSKEEKLAALRRKSADLSSDFGEQIADTTEKIEI